MTVTTIPELLPGDCLLYRPNSLFGHVIAVKTWTDISHVEVYIGGGESVGSRERLGVRKYPLRTGQLGFVLRPSLQPVDLEAGLRWFYSEALGQKYDYLGLLVFTHAVKKGARDRMFCSEFTTRFYRSANYPVFAPHWDADRVSPSLFLCSPKLVMWWSDGKGLT